MVHLMDIIVVHKKQTPALEQVCHVFIAAGNYDSIVNTMWSTFKSCSGLPGEELKEFVIQHLLMMKPDLSKQSLVGCLDLLSLGVAPSDQQLQDGLLIGPYGDTPWLLSQAVLTVLKC